MFKKNIKPVLLAGALALATAVSPVLAADYHQDSAGNKTYMDGPSINLTKTFNIADGADSFTSEKFYFTCSPNENSANAPTVEWKLGNTTLDPDVNGKVGITFEKSGTTNPSGTETLQLTFIPQQDKPTGLYTYTIKEVSGTNEKIVYDNSTYVVTVRVANANDDGTGVLVVDQIKIEKGNDKVGASTFVNNYNDSSDLIIKKVVTGKGANSKDDFKFTVNLTLPTNYSGTNEFEIVNAGTENLSITTVEKDNKNYITFGSSKTVSFTADFDNNDQILIKGLPVGTTYTVSEEDNGYEASYVVTKGQTKVTNSDNDNTKNSYENGLVYDSENTVVFTNEKDGENIGTGVIINNMPYIALLGASGAGLVVLAASKKRSKK